MQALVDNTTHKVLGTGSFPDGSYDPAIKHVVTLTDKDLTIIRTQLGEKFIQDDGTLSVGAPLPDTTTAQSAPVRFAELIANLSPALQSATTVDDLRTVFGDALQGLNAIYGTGQ